MPCHAKQFLKSFLALKKAILKISPLFDFEIVVKAPPELFHFQKIDASKHNFFVTEEAHFAYTQGKINVNPNQNEEKLLFSATQNRKQIAAVLQNYFWQVNTINIKASNLHTIFNTVVSVQIKPKKRNETIVMHFEKPPLKKIEKKRKNVANCVNKKKNQKMIPLKKSNLQKCNIYFEEEEQYMYPWHDFDDVDQLKDLAWPDTSKTFQEILQDTCANLGLEN